VIVKRIVKSCCGTKSYIFETEKAIKKNDLQKFIDAGYLVNQHFAKAGIFYVQLQGLIATAPFGTRKIQVRCNDKNYQKLISSFEGLLDFVTCKT